MRRILPSFFLLMVLANIHAQERLLSIESVDKRISMIRQLPLDAEMEKAVAFARENNLPVRMKYKDGTVIEIKRLTATGMPMYYKTFNLNAAKTLSTDKVWEGGGLGLNLSGAGIVVGLWDGGAIRTSHQEFGGRAMQMNKNIDLNSHATHVAGTIGASGVNPSARGMANLCRIEGYDWDNDDAEMRLAAIQGLLISNHSYGFIQGWEYNDEENRWQWWGDESVSETEDYLFGYYGEYARVWDEIAYEFPSYLIVKSAGNDRGEERPSGTEHYIFEDGDWILSTKTRDRDGGGLGFESIGTQATAKNILTVGAINDLTGGYVSGVDVEVADFSAFGPTDDGRVKPDIVGNGLRVYSSNSDNDDSYSAQDGTSSSSPNVAGSLALLQQQYKESNGSHMLASTLKALVLHTADDAGNSGPDYKFGWGIMNTAKASFQISDDPGYRIREETLLDQDVFAESFYCPGEEDIRVTVAWTDPPGKVPGIRLDPKNKILVNDLDIRMIKEADGTVIKPFVLNPSAPGTPAGNGDNVIDNVEQILIEAPKKGFYRLEISHKSILKDNQQDFSQVISGLEQEYMAYGYNEIHQYNGEIILTSGESYQDTMDVQWLIRPDNGQPIILNFSDFETEQDNDLLSVYDGEDETAPLLAQFSGHLTNPDTLLVSSGGTLYLTFTSNSDVTGQGFVANYCSVPPEGQYTIRGELYPCEGTTETYLALGQNGAWFVWDTEDQWEYIEWESNNIDLVIGNTLNTLKVLPVNHCGSGMEASLELLPLQGVPALSTYTGDTLACLGDSCVLKVDAFDHTEYDWILPGIWEGESQVDTLLYIPKSETGIIQVSALNSCGRSQPLRIEPNVIDVPDFEYIITEKEPPCATSAQSFYVYADSENQYLWEAGGDWEILGDAESDTVLLKVGSMQSTIYIKAYNKCGERISDRTFSPAPFPPEPELTETRTSYDYPFLTVPNSDAFDSFIWLLDGETLPVNEDVGLSSVVANRNGLYTVIGLSSEGCANLTDEGISIDQKRFRFLAYRINETKVVMENGTKSSAEITFFSLSGEACFTSVISPGYNEIPFLRSGIYFIQVRQAGESSAIKVYF